jgi:hypothetical protein
VVIDFNKKSTAPGIIQYPNPTSSVINISTNNSKDLIEHISFTDIAGKVILSRNLVPTKHYQQSVTSFQQGVYLVQVKNQLWYYYSKGRSGAIM